MLAAIRSDNSGPTLSSRNLAILHSAIYDAVNAIDGLQITFCSLFVKREQGRCFEGKHGKRRHQRIVQGNLDLGNAMIREGGEVLMKQAEERIGTEMFASFWRHSRHRNPQPAVIHERNRFQESRIVAFMFTKSQLEGWRGDWDLSTSGNCCMRPSTRLIGK